MNAEASIGARLGLAFDLEFRDAAGNVLKTVQCRGSVPLAETGLSVEQAQSLIEEQHGTHDSE